MMMVLKETVYKYSQLFSPGDCYVEGGMKNYYFLYLALSQKIYKTVVIIKVKDK